MDTDRGKQKDIIEDAGAVSLFRSRLAEKDLLPKSQDNYHTMLRFLKTTRSYHDGRYDYDRAICKWEKMINWRTSNGVDTIIQDFVYKEQEDARLFYPHGFHGVDKAGRPIFITYNTKVDCVELMKVTTLDRFVKSYIQECEKMVVEKFPACSEIAKKPIDSVVCIYVLPPFSYPGFNALSYSIVSRLGNIHHNYYPETIHQVFYINAGICPKLVTKLTNWLRDPRKKPVRFYALGQDFRSKLLEFIDEDQLPTSLGGSCSCPGKEGGCLRFEKGPWEVAQAKDKNAEMILNKRTEIAKTVQIIPRSSPETIQTYLQPRNGLGSAVSPEAACHQCTGLKNEVNSLSSKLDKLQTTLDLLLSTQDRANCSGVAGELSRHRNDSEQLSAAEERANFAEVQGIKLNKP